MLHRLSLGWSILCDAWRMPEGNDAMFEEILDDDARFDREHPGWNLDSRVLSARRFLTGGGGDPPGLDLARRIFGVDLVDLASDPLYVRGIWVRSARAALDRGEHEERLQVMYGDDVMRSARDDQQVHAAQVRHAVQRLRQGASVAHLTLDLGPDVAEQAQRFLMS